MELRHLRYFQAVAEELHFGRAAARLNISQPPLSQQIQKLESEIGARLFDRSNRKVSLTPAGELFLRRARSILDASESAAAEAANIAAGHQGRLAVGYMSAAMLDQFVPILHRFRETYPSVDVQLEQMSSPSQLAALSAGEIDIAFVDVPAADGRVLNGEAWVAGEVAWREAFVAALPVNHRLANQSAIGLSELAGDDFVLPPRDPASGFYDQVIALCQDAGFSPRLVRQSSVLPVTVAMVSAGYGVSIVPACVCQPWMGLAKFVGLTGDPSIGVTIAWRPDEMVPAIDHFRHIVEEMSPALITTAFDRAGFLGG